MKTLVALVTGLMLCGCVSQQSQKALADDQAGCAAGNRDACTAAFYQAQANQQEQQTNVSSLTGFLTTGAAGGAIAAEPVYGAPVYINGHPHWHHVELSRSYRPTSAPALGFQKGPVRPASAPALGFQKGPVRPASAPALGFQKGPVLPASAPALGFQKGPVLPASTPAQALQNRSVRPVTAVRTPAQVRKDH